MNKAKPSETAARRIFENCCNVLESHGMAFVKGDLSMLFDADSEEYNKEVEVRVDSRNRFFSMKTSLCTIAPGDQRLDLAVAACAATVRLPEGCFDVDLDTGVLSLRLVTVYSEKGPGTALFEHMVEYSDAVMDRFAGNFISLMSGVMELDDFLAALPKT